MSAWRALGPLLWAPYRMAMLPYLVARRLSVALRPGHAWRTWITPQILIGGYLLGREVETLRREGIGAVVNVTSELVDPEQALSAAGIAYLHVPCWDTRAPSLEAAERGVLFIAEHVGRGACVYVHCAGGVGRSVALALCYLATHEGFDVDEALAEIQRRRPRVNMQPNQRRFVDAYVARARGSGTVRA